MGVPIYIAMWLIKLDIGGAFVLNSSHTKKRLNNVEMANQHNTSHDWGSPRGCTQGDVKSPLSWICFFDTLVKALNQCQPDKYPMARTDGSVSHPVKPMVFMDDLTTGICYRKHTQAIADILAAFNGMSGTKNAVPKFRVVSTLSPEENALIIRDWEWQPTIVPFQNGFTCVRTLEIQINLVGNWSEQIQEASHCLARVENVIQAKKGSPTPRYQPSTSQSPKGCSTKEHTRCGHRRPSPNWKDTFHA
jgi:hypothetical protein